MHIHHKTPLLREYDMSMRIRGDYMKDVCSLFERPAQSEMYLLVHRKFIHLRSDVQFSNTDLVLQLQKSATKLQTPSRGSVACRPQLCLDTLRHDEQIIDAYTRLAVNTNHHQPDSSLVEIPSSAVPFTYPDIPNRQLLLPKEATSLEFIATHSVILAT